MIVIQPRDPPGAQPASFLGEFTIGRRAAPGIARPAGYQLDDDRAGLLHARISPGAAGWVVTDLGSRRVTLVNGIPVSRSVPVRLQRGDVLTIGATELIVVPDPP